MRVDVLFAIRHWHKVVECETHDSCKLGVLGNMQLVTSEMGW